MFNEKGFSIVKEEGVTRRDFAPYNYDFPRKIVIETKRSFLVFNTVEIDARNFVKGLCDCAVGIVESVNA